MRLCLAALIPAISLQAHVMSMSTGEATVSGKRLDYILRMPMYEVASLPDREVKLMRHVGFPGSRLDQQRCFVDGETFVCAAEYVFDQPVRYLTAECTLYAATVPNHVHVLHATLDGKEDRAFFDYTFTSATLRFRPPTYAEKAAQRMAEGAVRAVGGPFQLLFLLTLGLAARTRRELLWVVLAFLAGMFIGAALPWRPPERFAECAAAVGVAYLAVEILLLPDGGPRWWIGAALGMFQGLYLALFTGSEIAWFVTGAALASAAVCVLAGWLMLRRVPRWAASLPLAAGMFWFFSVLRS